MDPDRFKASHRVSFASLTALLMPSLLDHLSAVIQSSNRDFDPALTDFEVSQIAIIFNDNEN